MAEIQSDITCPDCRMTAAMQKLTDACQFIYDCTTFGAVLRPKPGDRFVNCSYGTLACPPIQDGASCC